MADQPSVDAPIGRTLPRDWYPGTIPANVAIDEAAYVETSFSFLACRSRAQVGVAIGAGTATYTGTMFDVGPRGSVSIGRDTLLNGARIICDERIEIGDYALISWNVVIMDTYRVPTDPLVRRRCLERVAGGAGRRLEPDEAADGVTGVAAWPVRIGSNVWIGFDVCVLPGVTVGEGSVIGAKSVVVSDVEPYTVVGGNPARMIRRLEPPLASVLPK